MSSVTHFHSPVVLDNSALLKAAPSIFATEPYLGMSGKYSFIPTFEVLDSLKSKGWLPVRAKEQISRNEAKHGFTKHLIRLRKDDAPVMVGDTVTEIVLVNAHDGGAAYQMFAGLFRLVCSNGLTVDDSTFERVSIRHSGDVIGNVLYAAKHIVKDVPRLSAAVKKMRAIELNPAAKHTFAEAALDLKYDRDKVSNLSLAPISAGQLLLPRRDEDTSADLWTTFNVIQENLMRGNQQGRSLARTQRCVHTRPVLSVDTDIRLNCALWALAQRMNN
jgi:hypothetical protein